MVETASNSVNVLLHRLNNTHLLTYCSAQLTRTLNCKHRLQYIGFSISLCVMYTCNYSYSSLPSVIAPRDECSREHSLPGTKVPGNFRSREQKFPGTFVLGSESSFRSEERKVPEPLQLCLYSVRMRCRCSSRRQNVVCTM